MAKKRIQIYDLIELPHGNLQVSDIRMEYWGSRITVTCIHSYPPEEKIFRVVLEGCRGIQWYVQKPMEELQVPLMGQLMSHDLGTENHQRPARFASTLVELIVTYATLRLEKDW